MCIRDRYKVGFNASRYTGGDKNEQDNIRNGMRIYTNDRQHNITLLTEKI